MINTMAKTKAPFPRMCEVCREIFPAGAEINYDRNTGATTHWKCKVREQELSRIDKTLNAELLAQWWHGEQWVYSLSGCSREECCGWTVGEVVASSKMDRELGYPEFLFVLQTSERYNEDEKEYYYEAICRQATEREAYPLIAEKGASK